MSSDLHQMTVENDVEMLQCPITKTPLRRSAEGDLVSVEGRHIYPVRNGVACFASGTASIGDGSANAAQDVREYYDAKGWEADNEGLFDDTRAFVDTRAVPLEYTHKCIARLNKYFEGGGRYLVDAGSGPITHQEYLHYSDRFTHRVCVDFSAPALRQAKFKLGDKGICLQGDLTNIPIRTGSVDAVTCNHVIYHIPAENQAAVIRELWRILRPGGVAVVVYAWNRAPIAGVLRRFAKLFRGDGRPPTAAPVNLFFAAHSPEWFRSQNWPFRYAFDTFRIIDNDFMKRYIDDNWFGRLVLRGFYTLQTLFPRFCGKYGAYPAIIIYKDEPT
jgi:SAM-dependent methyltransferase